MFVVVFATVFAASSELRGQSSLVDICGPPIPNFSGFFPTRQGCIALSQAITSAQSVIGLVYSGGSANLGYATGGLGLGITPRVSFGVRMNAVRIPLPDLINGQLLNSPVSVPGSTVLLPSAIIDGSVSLLEGVNLSPGVGGIGGLSLIGTIGGVPPLSDSDALSQKGLVWGTGARVRFLRESFNTPAISLTVIRRTLGEISYSGTCQLGIPECWEGARFDFTNWSGRITANKSLANFSGLIGLGYDRNTSAVNVTERLLSGPDMQTLTVTFTDLPLKSSRWTAFGGLSFNILVVSVTGEAGWSPGRSAIPGFENLNSSFDPKRGTFFGSLGARVAL
ncbi:MAG: hypothetical protein LBG44_03995 [Gemmatimonadota bacterium]|nr:hypothetical protein [Gemmatimonadota bacterium]